MLVSTLKETRNSILVIEKLHVVYFSISYYLLDVRYSGQFASYKLANDLFG